MITDGIIFDLDGTLWDSCRVVAESWGETLRRAYGAAEGPGTADIRGIMGMTGEQIARALFSGYGERAGEVSMRCMREEVDYIARHGGDVYPGVEEMLETLSREYPLFLVSNCQEGYIPCFLESTGFARYFRDTACEGSTGLSKAGNIALLCRRYALERPVYVGDTRMDEQSARAAGCAFVHARYGFGDAECPDAAAESPLELLDLFEKGETHHG